jgi:hypothetical protein
MPGARAPAASCAKVESTRVSHHEYAGNTRHSRTRMVLTASFVLSPVIGLVCHRRLRIWLVRPGWADFASADLTPASRRQDHTTSPSAATSLVSAPFDRSRTFRPALRSHHALRRCRVHRIPCPTSVTIAKRPSVGRDGGGYRSDLGQAGTRIFFQTGLDRANQIDPVQQIVVLAHRQGAPQSVIPGASPTGTRKARPRWRLPE